MKTTNGYWVKIAGVLLLGTLASACSSIEVTGRNLYSSQPVEESIAGEEADEITLSMAGRNRNRDEESQMRINRAIAHKDLVLGMSMAEVQHAWGHPAEVENAGHVRHGNERWIYRSGLSGKYSLKGQTRAVYFESGRVVGWQSE